MHVERFYTIRRVQHSTGRSDETVNLNILLIRNLNTTVPEDHSQYDVSTIKIRRLQSNNCRTEIFTLDYSISQGAPLVTPVSYTHLDVYKRQSLPLTTLLGLYSQILLLFLFITDGC